MWSSTQKDTETLQVSALGRSKAVHEFLVLHYFALDSAKHWDEVLTHVLPTVKLPGAEARRATALEAFGAFASQDASCFMDGLYDFDLEPADWR